MQESPAQRISSALDQPSEHLYDPSEAARIVHALTDGYFDPEYILLFGKLVGGKPHSVRDYRKPVRTALGTL